MKQTKPYGRAHWTAAERAAMALDADTSPAPVPAAAQAPDSPVAPDLFSLKASNTAAGSVTSRTNPVQHSWIFGSLAVVALCLFVLVRDSLLMAQILQQMSSEEAVMICKDGKMHYASRNPVDIVLGRGHFVCTDWAIRRSMLSIPRPYY